MLFKRQKLLLALLAAVDEPVQHTDFQKLLLLYTKDWEAEASYEFVPYQFGGFSFTSHADKAALIERGFLLPDEASWVLMKRGREAVRDMGELQRNVRCFVDHSANLRGDKLIAEAYRRHPYWAIRSKIIKRVLKSERERNAVEAQVPSKQPPGLLTIGYEGKSLEVYLNQLIRSDVTLLCDVRRNPLSRKYGFSKETLRRACERMGIRYDHLPELGIASERRKELNTQEDYDALFREYEKVDLPTKRNALVRIRDWIVSGERVALTCYEAMPCQCHRYSVASAVRRIVDAKFKLDHL